RATAPPLPAHLTPTRPHDSPGGDMANDPPRAGAPRGRIDHRVRALDRPPGPARVAESHACPGPIPRRPRPDRRGRAARATESPARRSLGAGRLHARARHPDPVALAG